MTAKYNRSEHRNSDEVKDGGMERTRKEMVYGILSREVRQEMRDHRGTRGDRMRENLSINRRKRA